MYVIENLIIYKMSYLWSTYVNLCKSYKQKYKQKHFSNLGDLKIPNFYSMIKIYLRQDFYNV